MIPLQELLKSSAFLVDDSCIFGVKILKIDVSSPEKKDNQEYASGGTLCSPPGMLLKSKQL